MSSFLKILIQPLVKRRIHNDTSEEDVDAILTVGRGCYHFEENKFVEGIVYSLARLQWWEFFKDLLIHFLQENEDAELEMIRQRRLQELQSQYKVAFT